jgi:hypothetical protein
LPVLFLRQLQLITTVAGITGIVTTGITTDITTADITTDTAPGLSASVGVQVIIATGKGSSVRPELTFLENRGANPCIDSTYDVL